MGQARLNQLSIYKDLLDGLELKVIASEFEHRQRVFGGFTTQVTP